MTSYFRRLASYRKLSLNDTIGYCTRLAELGYFYTGHNLEIECEGCKKKVQIFNGWSDSDLMGRLRHFPGCAFEQLGTDEPVGLYSDPFQAIRTITVGNTEISKSSTVDVEFESDFDGTNELVGAYSAIAIGNTEISKSSTVDVEFDESNEEIGAYSALQTDDTSYLSDNMLAATEDRTYPFIKFSSLPHSEFEAHLNIPRLHSGSSTSSTMSSTSSSGSSGYHSDLSIGQDGIVVANINTDIQESTSFLSNTTAKYSPLPPESIKFIAFSDHFNPEYIGLTSLREQSNSNDRNCKKNPGHFAYFNLNALRLEQIPSAFRCSEMLKLLKLMGSLTVKVVVSATSSQRGSEEHKVISQHKLRAGTGFVIEHACQEKQPTKNGGKSKLKSIKRMVTGGRKKNNWSVYIQTSRHLVFNDDEARSSTVEFVFDNPETKDAVTLEGKYVLMSATPDDSQCLLVCECSDLSFIQRLHQLQHDFYRLADGLPLGTKKRMSKKLFMIHHPHAGQKVLSYGDFVGVKYKYDSCGQSGQPTLTKLTAGEQVLPNVDLYRKTLLYAADTCPGSCGAPILTFTVRTAEAGYRQSMKPDIWMHNGVELKHTLGASILKVCTKDDFPQFGPEGTRFQQLTIPEEDSEDEDSLGKQQVSSPVYKVIKVLASSGFFYTGEADCVRCFQCGLGLRSWKAGDDVNTEHQKYRPQCPYLMSQTKGPQNVMSGAAASLDSNDPSTENISLKLLENENKTLKRQLTCKICSKSDVKDVFLPCGELYACSECSKLLTHCPSCNKPILATVTVYLT
ncbi:hypothetical protein Btru_052524 [Bulinus truncatus]|nr:hypothetical protein Btru_052524 [Bulinus truncatus]